MRLKILRKVVKYMSVRFELALEFLKYLCFKVCFQLRYPLVKKESDEVKKWH